MNDSFSSENSKENTSDEPRINLNEDQKKRAKKKLNTTLFGSLTVGGVALGSFFGPGGAIIGGLLGSVIALHRHFNS